MSLFDVAEDPPAPESNPLVVVSDDPYEALLAALDVQAEAKSAYYAARHVRDWHDLYRALCRANAGVTVAVRAWVAARSET